MVADFDGTQYGHDYLVFTKGAYVSPLEHTDSDGAWAYGAIGFGAESVHGWYPANYAGKDAVIQANSEFDGGGYGSDYLSFCTGARIRLLDHDESDEEWLFGELLSTA